jgi:hypothetical protein
MTDPGDGERGDAPHEEDTADAGADDSPDRLADADVPSPSTPELPDWQLTDQRVDRLFGVDGADVRGHTVVYEDRRLREAVREATDGAVDQAWRFVFATRLAFRPPLAPGAVSLVLPSVRTEATRSFLEDLRDRGVADPERGRRERFRTDDGDRLRLRQVTGSVSLGEESVPVEGWVCVRATDAIHVAGGAYPRQSLATALADADHGAETADVLARDPTADREELFAFVAGVG